MNNKNNWYKLLLLFFINIALSGVLVGAIFSLNIFFIIIVSLLLIIVSLFIIIFIIKISVIYAYIDIQKEKEGIAILDELDRLEKKKK